MVDNQFFLLMFLLFSGNTSSGQLVSGETIAALQDKLKTVGDGKRREVMGFNASQRLKLLDFV